MVNFKVSKQPLENQVKIVEAFLNKMAYPSSAGSYNVLLSGSPGVGKTSFIRMFAKLLAVEVLIIEAPSVIQEHLVQIPFLVYEPISDVPHQGVIEQKEENGQFTFAFSKSYLIQGLKGTHKVSDENYIEYIYKQNPHIIKLYEALGGTKDEIPEEIVDARHNYKDILFIDEYFRATPNIRNSLRGILNRQLGDTEIPKTTFIAFASNMDDEGVASEISSHQVYTKIDMDKPSKEGWFSWLMDKFKEDNNVQLKDEVMNKFHELIEEAHLAHDDLENEIRTSPRRWEQIILYVNDSIPVKDIAEANALLANVSANFTNADAKYSKLYEGVSKAVKELIKDTSGDVLSEEDLADLGNIEHDKWADHLKHQIQRNINLGEHRTYVPVVSGAPGIGKNAKIMQVAKELNLGVIMINAMNVDKDDVIGIPVTKGKPKKGQEVEMEFHTPKLLHDIEAKAKRLDAEMNFDPHQKAKYLIYFDEMDKVKDIDVFNSLRRVILEKEFANGEKVPDKSVMVAAINPSGTEGSHKFTGHMADVVDIIHAEPNWKEFVKHIGDKDLPEKLVKYKDKLRDLLEVFANKFKSEGKHGYWSLNTGGTELYVSPRDYSNIFQDSAVAYARIVKKVEKEESDDLTQFNDTIKDAVYETYTHGLGAMFDKANLKPDDFFQKLKIWFRSPDTDMLLKDVTMRRHTNVNQVDEVLKKMFEDKSYNPVNGEDDASQNFIAYMDSIDPTEFASHIREFLEGYVKEGGKQEMDLHIPVHDYRNEEGLETVTSPAGEAKYYRNLVVHTAKDKQDYKNFEATVEFTLESAMAHSKTFKKDLKSWVEEYNKDAEAHNEKASDEDKRPIISTSTNMKKMVSELNSKTLGKTVSSREIRNFINEFLLAKDSDGKYKYLEEIFEGDKDNEHYEKPLTKTMTYKNAHKLFHDMDLPKPVEAFANRLNKAMDELDLPGQFRDTVDRELVDELKKLEDEYLLKHVERI